MLFQSLDYFAFLALSLGLYWALRRFDRARFVVLFVASCAFYMAWHPAYILLILGSISVDWLSGVAIGAARSDRVRRAFLGLSVAMNLGLLGTFKYWDFAVTSFATTLGWGGLRVDPPLLGMALPVGISFYTFESLSYVIDVYRRDLRPERRLLRFGVFITYFPHLVAGPIVRPGDFLPQLHRSPSVSVERVSEGLFLIALGLVKKVAVADYLSVNLVDRVFDQPEAYTATEVVVGLYAFTMQIYCDFSGYTDIARGSAKLMGLELPENFDRPYQATSPADFWRRWHMTLSTWLRDYLYYPLGGSRTSPARAYFNLWITMFLIGVWHGASWTFVLYGVLQATAMVLHRAWQRARAKPAAPDRWPLRALKIALCLQFVVFSRILFRADGLENARAVALRLVSGTVSTAQLAPGVMAVLGLAFVAHYLPRDLLARLERSFTRLPAPAKGLALATVAAGLSYVATTETVPYIYFQF